MTTVELRKWPDRPHRLVEGVCLGEDRYGVWISAQDYVFVIPRDEWWIGRNFPDGGWKLDVTTVPQWTDGRVSMVDLDLDVRRRDGSVWLEDEDEFTASLQNGAIPPEFAAPARNTAVRLRDALASDQEPFATIGSRWLA